MATADITGIGFEGSALGTPLTQLLVTDAIQPGDDPSYQLCKVIYTFHPLGAKMAESPIRMAQCMPREISVAAGPEERIRDQFNKEWKRLRCDKQIFRLATFARVYGISTVALKIEGQSNEAPVDFADLWKKKFTFSVFDPLNTSGSLVLNQDPNAFDFQSPVEVRVQGKVYHSSRVCVLMNEDPIYIEYTTSGFGYVGRSVYQRALYPLKSFIQSMVTDDLVTKKAGLLIVFAQQAGSIVDNVMSKLAGTKRNLLKTGVSGHVLQVGKDDKVESINFQNLDGPLAIVRKDVLENIAVAADMPAKLLNSETFAEGFGEGTEDAKHVARYVDRIREELDPPYRFFDKIVQHVAWNPEFFETLKAEFPDEYGSTDFETFFYDSVNSFAAIWPSLLTEPDSEKIKVEETKYKTIIAAVEVEAPMLDPANKATLLEWANSNLNENKMIFTHPLELDYAALVDFNEDQAEQASALAMAGAASDEEGEPAEPKPFAASA